jgi:hypothetical protein
MEGGPRIGRREPAKSPLFWILWAPLIMATKDPATYKRTLLFTH